MSGRRTGQVEASLSHTREVGRMIRVLTPKRYLGRSKASRISELMASIFRLPGKRDGGRQEAGAAVFSGDKRAPGAVPLRKRVPGWYILAAHCWIILGDRGWHNLGAHCRTILGEQAWHILTRLMTAPLRVPFTWGVGVCERHCSSHPLGQGSSN